MDEAEAKRWQAVAYYWTDNGLASLTFNFDELEELQDLMEQGPSWYALDRIEVRYTDRHTDPQTVEESMRI
jgi:hypothetical protein